MSAYSKGDGMTPVQQMAHAFHNGQMSGTSEKAYDMSPADTRPEMCAMSASKYAPHLSKHRRPITSTLLTCHCADRQTPKGGKGTCCGALGTNDGICAMRGAFATKQSRV
eukprot:4759382-Amphidinium_carterae.2